MNKNCKSQTSTTGNLKSGLGTAGITSQESEDQLFLKKFEDLKFTDDFMFCTTLVNNPELCKEMAEMIIGKKISRIVSVRNQKEIQATPDGKGVRFDVCLEGEDEICDIEMQNRVDMKMIPKRARYYRSVMDVEELKKGATYQDLKKSYILFICKDNPFKDKGLHKYTFRNICEENRCLEMGDETEIILLTPKGDADDMSPEMEALMTYIADNETASDFTKRLDEAVEAIKNGEGWRIEYMQLKEKLDMSYDAGMDAGMEAGRKEIALKMLKKGNNTHEEIAELTDLPISEIEKLDCQTDGSH